MRPLLLAVIVASWWWSCTGAAAADATGELGVLTCSLEAARDVRPADEANEAGQLRDALCSFKSKTGEEEIYTARLRSVGVASQSLVTIIWLVKGRAQTPLPAGFLQQSYAADPKPAPDSVAPAVIGEVNPNIGLHPMADRPAGSASTQTKPRAPEFVITSVELRLRSTSG